MDRPVAWPGGLGGARLVAAIFALDVELLVVM